MGQFSLFPITNIHFGLLKSHYTASPAASAILLLFRVGVPEAILEVPEAILNVTEAILDVPKAILDVPEAILDVPEAILNVP